MIVSNIDEEKFAYQALVDEPVLSRRKRDQRHAAVAGMTLTAVVAVALVFMLLLYLGIQTKINRTSYILNGLKEELQSLKKENDLLNLKISELKSLDRIEREAIEKLGMKKPDQTKVLALMEVHHPQQLEVFETSSDTPERIELASVTQMRRTIQESMLAAFSQLTVRWFASSSAYSGD